MGPDIFILDLLKSEVRARENPRYRYKFCTSRTLMMRVKTCRCTCISGRKGDRTKEEPDSYLAHKVTICAWRDAASEEQSIVTKVTWLNQRGSRYVANDEQQKHEKYCVKVKRV